MWIERSFDFYYPKTTVIISKQKSQHGSWETQGSWPDMSLCKLRLKSYLFSFLFFFLSLLTHICGLIFFFYFILFLNFTILYWFCYISKWICHRHTCVPHAEPSSLLPPHTIPLGRPSAPAPSIQYRASNLDWQLVSCMIFYMFQCHSPKSSHPLPLPQSP